MTEQTTQRVDFSQIDGVLKQFVRERNEILRVGDDIRSDIQLLLTDWQGEAGAAYGNAYTRWNSGYNESLGVLSQLMADLEAALMNAHAVEQANLLKNSQG